MRHRIFLHLVWTTNRRNPTIDATAAEYLAEVLPIVARQERARILELGIVSTHVHLLLRLHPTTVIPRLVQRMKGGTSAGRISSARGIAIRVRWARGYNAESVSTRALEVVGHYVRHQHHHHPVEAIAGWPPPPDPESAVRVALATPAEPSL